MMGDIETPIGALSSLPGLWDFVEVKCPTCGENTPDSWLPFWPDSALLGELAPRAAVRHQYPALSDGVDSYKIEYMKCSNDACQQMVIRFEATHVTTQFVGGAPILKRNESGWFIYPRHASARLVDALVPDSTRSDYLEAAALLDISPRMSAVLSRRILADLLESYAHLNDYRLSARIDQFIQNTTHPIRIRENLHALRSMGDFSAHTKRDESDQSIVIDVGREEAEWTLDVLDRLFDYFIVAPAKDAVRRAEINAKRIAAGQNPIPELSDEQKGAT